MFVGFFLVLRMEGVITKVIKTGPAGTTSSTMNRNNIRSETP